MKAAKMEYTHAMGKPILARQKILNIEDLMLDNVLNQIASDADAEIYKLHLLPATKIHFSAIDYGNIFANTHHIKIQKRYRRMPIKRRSEQEREILDIVMSDSSTMGLSLINVFQKIADTWFAKYGLGIKRTKDIGLCWGKNDPEVMLIPPQNKVSLDSQILSIYNSPGSPFLGAVLIYFTILHYHPFSDGNGRIARTMFNFLLRQNGMLASEYLPLSEIMGHSRGQYEIAFRYAEILRIWSPLTRFMVLALKTARLQ